MIENQKPQESSSEFFISEATMSKSLDELKEERKKLADDIKGLEADLAETKAKNPTDFAKFKSINGKLRGTQQLLEEVQVVLVIKTKEETGANDGLNDFDRALMGTGEFQQVNKLDEARKRATGR